MSHSAMIVRSCQFMQLRNNLLYIKPSIAINSVRSAHSKRASSDIVIDNVVKDRPVNFETMFNHQRIRRAHKIQPMPKIVYKKKDQNPEVYPCLEERLIELDPELRDLELYKKINIGMSFQETETPSQKRLRQRQVIASLKQDKQLNKLANDHKLEIDILAVQKDYLTNTGPYHTRLLALHCGVFKDLFGPYAYFDAIVPLLVEYDYSEDEVSPIYRGNIIKPSEACSQPSVSFPSPDDGLWTLALTNPDGDLYKQDSECCHWLVTNIRGNDVSTGTVVVPYLAPVPPRGVGYQRMVFVLYKQTETIAHQHEMEGDFDLPSRSFSTSSFYRQHEASITPAGLSWYNTDWDTSVGAYYHDKLGMKEPLFEYQFPGPYIKPEEHCPRVRNFTAYIDMYRDPVANSERMLLKRLRNLDPFKKEHTRLPYPSAQPINRHLPSWQKQMIKEERLGYGRYRELYRDDYRVDNDEDIADAAAVEVDKKHSSRLGLEWHKSNVGVKKRKDITAEEDKVFEKKRLESVTFANLD